MSSVRSEIARRSRWFSFSKRRCLRTVGHRSSGLRPGLVERKVPGHLRTSITTWLRSTRSTASPWAFACVRSSRDNQNTAGYPTTPLCSDTPLLCLQGELEEPDGVLSRDRLPLSGTDGCRIEPGGSLLHNTRSMRRRRGGPSRSTLTRTGSSSAKLARSSPTAGSGASRRSMIPGTLCRCWRESRAHRGTAHRSRTGRCRPPSSGCGDGSAAMPMATGRWSAS